ncbi:hypothetical protein K474DRAFT_955755 [Panus rudis PR-1116 ss-1]|nr:hypothetical protein K474DRAFT_955755 [Panus rudis PR-1116 ss-1]
MRAVTGMLNWLILEPHLLMFRGVLTVLYRRWSTPINPNSRGPIHKDAWEKDEIPPQRGRRDPSDPKRLTLVEKMNKHTASAPLIVGAGFLVIFDCSILRLRLLQLCVMVARGALLVIGAGLSFMFDCGILRAGTLKVWTAETQDSPLLLWIYTLAP